LQHSDNFHFQNSVDAGNIATSRADLLPHIQEVPILSK
jgi:hypothetical protein